MVNVPLNNKQFDKNILSIQKIFQYFKFKINDDLNF